VPVWKRGGYWWTTKATFTHDLRGLAVALC